MDFYVVRTQQLNLLQDKCRNWYILEELQARKTVEVNSEADINKGTDTEEAQLLKVPV